jgi:hypothetical protein
MWRVTFATNIDIGRSRETMENGTTVSVQGNDVPWKSGPHGATVLTRKGNWRTARRGGDAGRILAVLPLPNQPPLQFHALMDVIEAGLSISLGGQGLPCPWRPRGPVIDISCVSHSRLISYAAIPPSKQTGPRWPRGPETPGPPSESSGPTPGWCGPLVRGWPRLVGAEVEPRIDGTTLVIVWSVGPSARQFNGAEVEPNPCPFATRPKTSSSGRPLWRA